MAKTEYSAAKEALENTSRYQIVYTKDRSLVVWRESYKAALSFAEKFRRAGYTVDIWEHTPTGSRLVNSDSADLVRIFGTKVQNG